MPTLKNADEILENDVNSIRRAGRELGNIAIRNVSINTPTGIQSQTGDIVKDAYYEFIAYLSELDSLLLQLSSYLDTNSRGLSGGARIIQKPRFTAKYTGRRNLTSWAYPEGGVPVGGARTNRYDDDNSGDDEPSVAIDFDDNRNNNTQVNPILNLLSKIMTLISRMNILYNSKIRKNINNFDRIDIQDIASKLDYTENLFNSIDGRDIIINVNKGLHIYLSVSKAFNKLIGDVNTSLKSYTEKRRGGNHMPGHMTGGFMNFETPHFKKDYVNIPTKYLL
jgi:hypothetical protein